VTNQDIAPGTQLELPLGKSSRGEIQVGKPEEDAPVNGEQLMERALEKGNLIRALRQVQRKGGSPGIDGMTVEELPTYLKEHWPAIREALLGGTYEPQPVKRVEIPKPDGGIRLLGVPTVLDRCIQQALLQVVQAEWDPTFSDASYGFRPGRSAHQALLRAQAYVHQGYAWVVDMDLEKCFDRVNHDKLMSLVKERVSDRRVLKLIDRFLKAGVMIGEGWHPSMEGTPQGGPISPLLTNLLLDRLDKELEKRGHKFVRYADDCNIYVKSKRAGERVLASVTRFLSRKLKLKVNAQKSAVDRPWRRKFLGFTFTHSGPHRRKVSGKALERFKEVIRGRTQRTRGKTIRQVVAELGNYINGWKAYFGLAQVKSVFKELDSWIRRRLRCYLWKQWGRRGYRELLRRGISRELAWNTAKSAHGPWRLSKSPGLSIALPGRFFDALGLPRLFETKSQLT
jgi:RNA-directed DNA polymerase